MDPITVNLHYATSENRTFSISKQPVTLSDKQAFVPGISSYTMQDVTVYGFDEAIADGAFVLMVQMLLPAYFNEINLDDDVLGFFLVSLHQNDQTVTIMHEHALGKHGCPNLIKVGDLKSPGDDGYTKDRFTFNKMSFHPFVLPSMTIGWYVCDQGGPLDFDDRLPLTDKLGLDDPLVYDATLGLFITRGASRK